MGRIVVGYDGSEQAVAAVDWAAGEAARRGSELLVLESWHEPTFGGSSMVDRWMDPQAEEREERDAFDLYISGLQDRFPDLTITGELHAERAATALIAASAHAELVVVGARGRGGFASLLLGSVSRKVAWGAECTVVVLRGAPMPGGPVVVGVDGSAGSRHALHRAADAARAAGVPLHVVMGWHPLAPVGEHGPMPFYAGYTTDDAEATAQAIVTQVLGASPGVDVQVEAVCDSAAKALVDRAAGASLVVVGPGTTGTTARSGGSVAAPVLAHATCPVVIARP